MGEHEEERKDQDGVWDTQVAPPLLNPEEELRPSHSGGSHSPALYSHATFPAQDSVLVTPRVRIPCVFQGQPDR